MVQDFFSDKSSLQELSIYLFKKNMNRKILLLGKERDAHFDFPFISCWIADGGLTLPRRKKAVQYYDYVGTTMCDVESRVLRSFILGV